MQPSMRFCFLFPIQESAISGGLPSIYPTFEVKNA